MPPDGSRQNTSLPVFLKSKEHKAACPSPSSGSKGASLQGTPLRRRGPLDRRTRLRKRLLATSVRPLFSHQTRGDAPDKLPLPAPCATAAAAADDAAAVTPLSEEVGLLQQGVCPSRLERLLQQQLQRQQQQRRDKRREKQQQLERLRLRQTQQLHALQQRFDFASAAAAAAGEAPQQQQHQQQQQGCSPTAEAAALAAAGLLARLRACRLGLQLNQLNSPYQQGAQHPLLPASLPRLHRGFKLECRSSSSSSGCSSRDSSRGLDGRGRTLAEEKQRTYSSGMTQMENHEEETSLWSLSGTAASVSHLHRNVSTEINSEEDTAFAPPVTPHNNNSSSSNSSSSRVRTEERGIQVSIQLISRREKCQDLISPNPLSLSAAHSSVTDEVACAVSFQRTDKLEEQKNQNWETHLETAGSSRSLGALTASLPSNRRIAFVERLEETISSEEERDACNEQLHGPVAAAHSAAAEASSSAFRGEGMSESKKQLALPASAAAGATTEIANPAAATGATAAEAAARRTAAAPAPAAAATAGATAAEATAGSTAAGAGAKATVQTRGIPLVLVMREKYPRWRRRRASRVGSEGPPRLHKKSENPLPLLLGREWGPPREASPASAGVLLSAEKGNLPEEPLIASVSGVDACMQFGAPPTQRLQLAGAAGNSGSCRQRGSGRSKGLKKEEGSGKHAVDRWSSLRYGGVRSSAADAFDSLSSKTISYHLNSNSYNNDVFEEVVAQAPAWRARETPQVLTSGPLSISTVDDQWSSRVEENTKEGKVQISGFTQRRKSDFLSRSFAAKTLMSSVSD